MKRIIFKPVYCNTAFLEPMNSISISTKVLKLEY